MNNPFYQHFLYIKKIFCKIHVSSAFSRKARCSSLFSSFLSENKKRGDELPLLQSSVASLSKSSKPKLLYSASDISKYLSYHEIHGTTHAITYLFMLGRYPTRYSFSLRIFSFCNIIIFFHMP